MSDASHLSRSLRERLGGGAEERLGRLLENPLLTGAIGRAFDAREKAAQAQEVAMGALNIPSAADIERLTRRLRSVSLRLEGIEEGVDRLDRTLAPAGSEPSHLAERLSAVESQLARLSDKLDRDAAPPRAAKARKRAKAAGAAKAARPAKPAAAKSARAAKATRRAKPAGRGSGGPAKG
jgi:hypothetical protein